MSGTGGIFSFTQEECAEVLNGNEGEDEEGEKIKKAKK